MLKREHAQKNELAAHGGRRSETKQRNQPRINELMKTRKVYWSSAAVFGAGTALILALSTLAVSPQPALKIAALGTNQFSITVTNGVSGTNYTLFWTSGLADENYPWIVLGVGGTNFMVNGGEYPIGFFRVLLGDDSDGDGVTEQYDANSNDPLVGILSVIINSPTNGAVLQ
jgi:hypothetical protein